MNIEELKKKYPGVKFYDPPRSGTYFICEECQIKVWLPEFTGEISSYPHKRNCSHYNKGFEGVIINGYT